jgi:hypothetical protein
MSNVISGSNVSVEALIDGEYFVIGCAVSCSFEFRNELIGKTDVNAGLNRKKRVRISDFSGNVQGLTTINSSSTRLTVFHFLQEAVRRSEQTMRFVFRDNAGDTRFIGGLFLVEAVNISAEISGFSEFDLQLQGTGGITIGTVDPPAEIFCPELFSDTWETEETETSISGSGIQGRSFAGHQVLEVDREGTQYDLKESGSPGNREYAYNGTQITFEIPFYDGERVFVVWKAIES